MRRHILAAALAAPALLTRRARAADREIVLMMSGGSFMTMWQQKIIDSFQAKTGLRVRMSPGSGKAQGIALRANPSNPPFDVFLGNGDDFLRLRAANLFVPLSPGAVPALAELYPQFRDRWDGTGASFDYSSVGIAYRTDQVKSPPTSWKEFIDRIAAGEFGASAFLAAMGAGVRGPETLVTIARALTGNPENVDVAFDALRRMKPYVFKWFTTFNDPVVLLENNEGTIGTGWDGRTFVAHDQDGGKMDWIRPKEGCCSTGPVLAAVRNGNEEGAQALINHALGAEAQKGFCEAMFYGSVNSKVQYSEMLAKRIPPVDGIFVPEDAMLMKNLSGWIERWNREIAS